MSDREVHAALESARRLFSAASIDPAAIWSAAESVLQKAVGGTSLRGRALIAEARTAGRIGLSDAHALVTLAAWAEDKTLSADRHAERRVISEAESALINAVNHTGNPSARADMRTSSETATHHVSPSTGSLSGDQSNSPIEHESVDHLQNARSSRRIWLAVAAVLIVLVGATVPWIFVLRPEREYDAAVRAYERGSLEAARVQFESYSSRHADDARPLIYLGRIARETGDMTLSRTLLASAVRLAPQSALAARELAGTMLADKQPDIARRFYVRALELDPGDRSAQGFLGCSLALLGRTDEASNWLNRAGPGDWQSCARITAAESPSVSVQSSSSRTAARTGSGR